MKLKTLFCTLILSTFLVACGGEDTPEEFGETLFEHLKNGDKEAFVALSVNEEDFYWMVSQKNKAENTNNTPSPSELKREVTNLKRKISKNIDEIIAYGKMNGGWDNATLVDVEGTLNESFINKMDLFLHIDIEGKQYRVKFDDLLMSERGWVMFDKPRWLGLSYDPQFDKLIGEKLSIKPNNVFVSCKTPLDVTSLDILLRGKNNDSEVSEFLNSGKCTTNKSASQVTVTIEELGEYTMSAKDKFAKGEAEFPFEKIKISFEIDGQQKSGWTYTRWLASQAQ